MLNNLILIVLFVCFVSGLIYVYLRLKEETGKTKKKGGEELQISPEDIYKQVEALKSLQKNIWRRTRIITI